ncbi:MAG: cellulase family glycosylhydrolase [Haloarculaceae archaeon]
MTGEIDAFVETEGTDLVVDGERFRVFGGNHPQLRDLSAESVDAWFDDWLSVAPEINTLRATAFGTAESGGTSPLMPAPGEWNEAAFERLDYLVARAGEAGVRLVLPLTNYWDWQGGIPQYVEWADDASEKADFYTSERCQTWYREHVERVLTRENTVTGVEYREDPTIMLWQLSNEPRPGNFEDEEDTDETGFEEMVDAFVEWCGDTAAYVDSLAPDQLVTTGLDRVPGNDTGAADWYADAHAHESVDLWSTHVWAAPHHADVGIDGGEEWIENHAAFAHERDMPAFVGEMGWNLPDDPDERADEGLRTRGDALLSWFTAIDEVGMAGGLAWDLRLREEYAMGWNPFAIYPQEPHTPEAIAEAGRRVVGED